MQNVLVWPEFFNIKRSSLPFWPIGSGTKRTNLIWSRNCLRGSGTFLCNKKTNRLKQNILIWSKKKFIKSRSFLYWPKDSGTKQNNLIWSGKYLMQSGTFLVNTQTYRSKQNVLNWYKLFFCQSRSFPFWPKKSGTEAKQFDVYSGSKNNNWEEGSVADPNPGSGAFRPPGPGIRDG